jgi:hypothetical protein
MTGKSPLACPEKFGERGFRGVFEQAKYIDSRQQTHILPNLSPVDKDASNDTTRHIERNFERALSSKCVFDFVPAK